jgi:hypothetical protein
MRTTSVLILLALLTSACATQQRGARMGSFPVAGQGQEQHRADREACDQQAQQITGSSMAEESLTGGAWGLAIGALLGAAVGAAAGAALGMPGEGAAWGAAIGGGVGGAQGLAGGAAVNASTWQANFSACLQARGYTVAR